MRSDKPDQQAQIYLIFCRVLFQQNQSWYYISLTEFRFLFVLHSLITILISLNFGY